MKLELKHLAQYLPFSLKIYNPTYGLMEMDCWGAGSRITKGKLIHIQGVLEGHSKPILRHISSLEAYFSKLFDENIDVRTFLNEGFLTEENQFIDIQDMVQNYKIEWWPHGVIKLCLEHHFDLYGLIDSGLALDASATPHAGQSNAVQRESIAAVPEIKAMQLHSELF